MVHPVAQLQHEGRGARIDPTGLTARYRRAGQPRAEVRPDAMRAGLRAFANGDLELVIERQDHGSAATLNAHLVNRGAAPLDVESIEFAFEFRGHGHDDLRFLRHGWQSWSPTAVRVLDDAGEPPFPSGPWLRGMYHSQGESRPGVHESETLTAVGGMAGGPFCLVGVLESGRGFGLVRLAPAASDGGERPVVVEVELGLEISLAPGERRDLESIRLALGPEPNALLEQFAELWGSVAGARRAAPFQAGWCSWYHFFHAVSEEAMLRNIDALAADRSGIPVEVVQLDDGFQPAMGDWLAPSARFPGGPGRIAEAIRQAGFRAGIWTAPFAASAESEVLSAHSDWALDDEGSPLRGTYNPEWSRDGWVYVLDPSRPEVAAHLEATFAALVEMGFDYLKLDFLFMPAMRGRGADPSLTRAQRLARGLEAIRRGAGEDAFLLGCGCPLGPAVGRVDGMRIGPDVAPAWAVEQPVAIPGLEEMLPSTRTALRSILARQFLHRRLWLNDPDCLMVRSRETRLSAVETASLAAGVALSGGMVVCSDDVPLLEPGERGIVARVVELASRIDAAGSRGTTRVAWPGREGEPWLVESRSGRDAWLAAINLEDEPASLALPRGSVFETADTGPEILHPGANPSEASAGPAGFRLAAHASAILRAEGARRPAVFCDFDGTFSQRDVGGALAREYLPEARAALQKRYAAGELGAWEYALELFDGFAFAPDRLDAFLAQIELDSGARDLLAWCEAQNIPFRILSDGFDYNLERLQAIHGVAFAYSANRLVFEGERWRIAPGGPNADCGCGTGTCKRTIIEGYRREHPGAFCIHIGDGRVSDLCGAMAADLVFAKGTLVEALKVRGVHFEAFEDLAEVRRALERAFPGTLIPAAPGSRASGDFRS